MMFYVILYGLPKYIKCTFTVFFYFITNYFGQVFAKPLTKALEKPLLCFKKRVPQCRCMGRLLTLLFRLQSKY